MERKEAIALLKQLAVANLVEPFMVALKKNNNGRFEIIMKVECDIQELKQFADKRNLMLKENTKKGYCIIFKP